MTNYSALKTFKRSQINGLTKLLGSTRFADNKRKEKVIAMKNLIGLDHIGNEYCEAYSAHSNVLHFAKAKKITKEQSDFGKTWLKSHCFKLTGSPRLHAKDYNDRVLSIAKNVSRFEFIGVLAILSNYSVEPVQYLPIYRTYNKKGEYFDYTPIHWGKPVIMEGY